VKKPKKKKGDKVAEHHLVPGAPDAGVEFYVAEDPSRG
jgi:hypothetical protein